MSERIQNTLDDILKVLKDICIILDKMNAYIGAKNASKKQSANETIRRDGKRGEDEPTRIS